MQELTGPWSVQFDPAWFYPDNGTGGKMTFDDLSDWTDRPEPGIKHYSGIAVYRKTFAFSQVSSSKLPVSRLLLDLGVVKNVIK